MGRLGDIHGRRRIFVYGIVVFTVGCGLLSQSWSIESLIALRFLQGIGGSMIMATTIAIVVAVFPPEERGKALGIANLEIAPINLISPRDYKLELGSVPCP